MPYRRRRVADGERFTMDEFRDEMKRRGVYTKPTTIATTSRRDYMRQYMRDRRRAGNETAPAFFGAILQAAKAKLAQLEGRTGRTEMLCPWRNLGPHTDQCHCVGTGRVTVTYYRLHCHALIERYQGLAA